MERIELTRRCRFGFQEENNNSVSNQHSMSDEAFNHSQLLQTLTSAAVQDQLQQNPANNQSDAHDNLIALATALRSTANASPLPAQSSIRQLNTLSSSSGRNHFAANNNHSLLNGKLLSPNISDLDNLTISSNSRPLRPPDSKGKYRINLFPLPDFDRHS